MARRKGGERMSLEAIKQVTESEEKARAALAQAQADAKRMVADARREGEARVAAALEQAEVQVKAGMEQAEARAVEHAAQVGAESRKTCDALKAKAEQRLSQAADLIMERVVGV